MLHKNIIEEARKVFVYLDENAVIEIFKFKSEEGVTIFELMNELHKENAVKRNKQERTDKVLKFMEKFSVMESKDERFVSNTHEYFIKQYKTQEITDKENKLQQAECYLDRSDRRRKVLKDVNGLYNYLPELCPDHKDNIVSEQDQCPLAHSEVEVNYHPLVYKTAFCKKRCKDTFCFKAHNLEDDFRRIYDYKRRDTIELTIKLEESDLFKQTLINYMSYFGVPDSFSLDTYKVTPCKLNSFCGMDSHTCLNYHDLKERRRPPKLFHLVNEICEMAKPERNSDFFPHMCRYKDHCEKMHTRYELLYYEDNFRKVKPCTRGKVEGRCKFYSTCYGIHDDDSKY